MPAQKVSITVDRQARSIKPGAARGQDLINLANLGQDEQLMLEVAGDVDIPLSPEDVIFIRGGEQFSIGDGTPEVADNPRVRKPLKLVLNDEQLPEGQESHHAKLTGAELKALVGGGDVDLWADLDGIADELVADTDRVVLQVQDRFFTVPREEDRFYEVTVILDGEDRPRRFPAMMTVREAIRRSLSSADRPKVDEFEMVDGDVGTAALNASSTLKAAGVRDGHVLSITKKNGGGG